MSTDKYTCSNLVWRRGKAAIDLTFLVSECSAARGQVCQVQLHAADFLDAVFFAQPKPYLDGVAVEQVGVGQLAQPLLLRSS